VAPLREAAARAAAAFAAVLAASPFATAEAVGAAALAGATIERIAADLQAAEQEELTARELVSAYGRDLAGRTAPDLAALETAQAEAVAALERCRAADEQVRRQVDDCELLAAAHAAIAARLAAVEADFATASRLQQMVSGTAHAGERMSLHRWVLGAVLEQVVAQATVLLRQMTRGRYELLRSQAAGDRKSLAGLDIDILDVWTGTRRSARTLSGGETFLAALALSLALAKTAEAHQGGRRLETVFIDEGFGSLDAETLEYALTALHSLRDEGRVVGVISHVEEMQRTIPVQLRLLRRGETTTTEIVGLPGP
jgi:exonuclease SbcC